MKKVLSLIALSLSFSIVWTNIAMATTSSAEVNSLVQNIQTFSTKMLKEKANRKILFDANYDRLKKTTSQLTAKNETLPSSADKKKVMAILSQCEDALSEVKILMEK